MKKILIAVCSITILFAGCKEHDTPIDFGVTVVSDSTWVMAPPPPAPHNVLVEEFTGQSCGNCPAAHASLDALIAEPGYGTRINVISIYPLSSIAGNLAYPPPGATYNFTDTNATSILTTVYSSFPGLPCAGIDRIVYGGSMINTSGLWADIINQQKMVIDSVNLSVSSTFNTLTQTATITVQVIYVDSVSVPQNLSVVVVQDTIYDFQKVATNGNEVVDSNYCFNDVYRSMLTSVPLGDVLPSAKGPGRVYQRVYSYTPKPHNPSEPAPNPAHERVIAFVNCANGSDVHVVQSAQCPLE